MDNYCLRLLIIYLDCYFFL